jgi:MFS family permease
VRLLPSDASPDARVLVTSRGLRAFADGLVSVVLPGYLVLLGFSGLQVGAVVTATLLGSAGLTLLVGLRGHRLRRIVLLQAVAGLMIATGIGFAATTTFWILIVVAVVGTLNPSSGDVSVFLPTEQALYGRYGLVGSALGALGALAAVVPETLADHSRLSERQALRGVFVVYALVGLLTLDRYRHLSPRVEPQDGPVQQALGPSRRIVYRLTWLFGLDSLGGGLAVPALLVLWLHRRFGLSTAGAGAILFWAGLISSLSALVAVCIAGRLGLVRTMVFTHLPANGFLILTPLMPNLTLAIACLLARSALAQMDVPVRNSYVMAVVTPEERPAAASVTSVPRSLAAAIAPLPAGWMLDRWSFAWPFVIAGIVKALYDVLLLAVFSDVKPPEERAGTG